MVSSSYCGRTDPSDGEALCSRMCRLFDVPNSLRLAGSTLLYMLSCTLMGADKVHDLVGTEPQRPVHVESDSPDFVYCTNDEKHAYHS